jgi:succinyl-diaminopimelate desuccinylase
LELTQRLVRIPSVTPEDHGCQAVLCDILDGLGFQIHRLRYGVVENFYARLGNTAPHFCFAGHTDVVPPGDRNAWLCDPFAAEIRDGWLIGRGVCDMKGGIAAMVAAVARFLAQRPTFAQDGGGSLSFLITGDEEGVATDGTVRVLAWLTQRNETIDCCLVGEPSNPQQFGEAIKSGRRGSLNGTLTLHGKQGHVAYPHLAHNPIHAAMPVLGELAAIEWDQGNASFDPTALQFTHIESGAGAENVIPGRLRALFNIRFNTEQTPERLEQRLRAVLGRSSMPYDLALRVSGLPFRTVDGPFLRALQRSVTAVLGTPPQFSTSGGTSDARFIARHCPETAEFGPVARTIHQVNEQCRTEELHQLSAIYLHLLHTLFPDHAP